MESTVRVSTSFRLNADLVEKMKAAAKSSNRSLNNYVESILLKVMSQSSNSDATMSAIEEAKEQQQAYKNGTLNVQPIDVANVDAFIKSLGL